MGFFLCHFLDYRATEKRHKHSRTNHSETEFDLKLNKVKTKIQTKNLAPKDESEETFEEELPPEMRVANLTNFVKHESIFGTFWFSKKTRPRTIAFTRLYVTLLIEAVVTGLIIYDSHTGNELWDNWLVHEVNASTLHSMATCIFTSIILGMVYHTVVTFLFRQRRDEDDTIKDKFVNFISITLGYCASWIILAYCMYFIFIIFDISDDDLKTWITYCLVILLTELLIIGFAKVVIKYFLIKCRCICPGFKKYLEDI